jgi:acyl-CoA thioester hydrolase
VSELPRHGRIVDGIHHCPLRVYYEDTDADGIVYYANYLNFAERARTEMLRCCGVEQGQMRRDGGLFLVVRRSTIDFLAPARLDDDLVVLTRLASYAGAALAIAQEIRRGDPVRARLESRVACVNESGRPTRLPPPLVAAIASLLRPHPRMVTADAR